MVSLTVESFEKAAIDDDQDAVNSFWKFRQSGRLFNGRMQGIADRSGTDSHVNPSPSRDITTHVLRTLAEKHARSALLRAKKSGVTMVPAADRGNARRGVPYLNR
jgi:hypothetical protein